MGRSPASSGNLDSHFDIRVVQIRPMAQWATLPEGGDTGQVDSISNGKSEVFLIMPPSAQGVQGNSSGADHAKIKSSMPK